MIANTMGILEILYILFFSKTKEELKQMTQKLPTRKYFSKTKQTPEQTPASEITEEDKN